MKLEKSLGLKIQKNIFASLFIYALPLVLMFTWFYISQQKPWLHQPNTALPFKAPAIIEAIFLNLKTWGLPVLVLTIGVIEFAFGLYENKWTKNEKILDIVCFIAPRFIIIPFTTYFTLKLLPFVFPQGKDVFSWVPFWWACLIIAVADDLTQYWYHRLHHQVPFLWRFHRTHHSAPYMGMAMASRQNVLYTIFFSQIYLTAALVYFGLGYAALFVTVVKSLITTGAHSSIAWDKPFYKYKILHPVGWLLEHTISTPATHWAHHADTSDDGVGYYKRNFGNMFFIWDLIFNTGIITRRYPETFGTKAYKQEEWYAQFAWPLFKSKKEGSELSKNGPVVADEISESITIESKHQKNETVEVTLAV